MVSSSTGTYSSGKNLSGFEELEDHKKRKRMQSNRESARRSRMRKQQYLEDLTVQMDHLSRENNEILLRAKRTTQLYMNLEAENSIVRAQMEELGHRLQSLNEIINYINSSSSAMNINPWSSSSAPTSFMNQQIIAVPAADVFMC